MPQAMLHRPGRAFGAALICCIACPPGMAAAPASRRIDLAEFATAVRYDGDTPETITATALERGVDGWEVYTLPDGTRAIGLEWDGPRELAEVNIEFRHAIAHRERIRVQYWTAGKADAARGGIEDAFHGRWVTARADWWAGDRDVSFAFIRGDPDAPPGPGEEPVVIRTRRLRFLCGPDDLPPVRYLRAYGSHEPSEATFIIRSTSGTPDRTSWDAAVVNGLFPSRETSAVLKTARISGNPAELTVRFSPDEKGDSRTIVTLRDAVDRGSGFSFLPAEVRRRGMITVPALGVTVAVGDVPAPETRVAESAPAASATSNSSLSQAGLSAETSPQPGPPTASQPVAGLLVPDVGLMRLAARWLRSATSQPTEPPDTLVGCWTAWSLDLFGFHEAARDLIGAMTAGREPARPDGRFLDVNGFLPRKRRADPGTSATALEHAMLLWTIAHHHALTADRAWTQQHADLLLSACDWLIQQRRAPAAKAFPLAAFDDWGAGLLPPNALLAGGSWHEWVAADAWAVRAMCAAADALADLEHPQTGRIAAAAADYRADLLVACREAVIRTPVICMSEGTFARGVPARYRVLRVEDHSMSGGLAAPVQLVDCGIGADDPGEWHEAHLSACPPAGPAAMWTALAVARAGRQLRAGTLLRDAIRSAGTMPVAGESVQGMDRDASTTTAVSIDAAALLIWTRRALLEERGSAIHLLEGVPREWLTPGSRILLESAATRFGPMRLEVECTEEGASIRWRRQVASGPGRSGPIRVRVHLPAFGAFTGLTVDGRPWPAPRPAFVDLNAGAAEATVVVRR